MVKKSKIALMNGITGQDGNKPAALLVSKSYIVNGLKRRTSSFISPRVDHLYKDAHKEDSNNAKKGYLLRNKEFPIYSSQE